ncbi:MAG: hypothetical protein IH945_08905, partial [Armatimonadetes bacterium]|nr:hypothetical protein [Armatimonadota bacterium]
DLGNSNPVAGTLSETTVTITEGNQLSPQFTFTADVVSTDQMTTLSASRTGYTTRTVDVTVRAMTLVLTIDPTVVIGGLSDSVGTVTLSVPAPSTGLTIAIKSGDNAFASVPASIDIAGGATSETFDIVTAVTQADRFILITATASSAVSDAASLAVLAPGIVSLSIDPSSVTGPDSAVGTVTLATAAPDGGLTVVLASNLPSVVMPPPTVTVPEGFTEGTFNILTSPVNLDATATVTATIGGSVANATLTVRSPIVAGITFSPPRILGGGIAIGTITLDQPAPAGGTTVNIVSHDTNLAFILGASTVLIPPGSRTGTFNVQTRRVTRIIAVRFTGGLATGYLYIKP